jgi:hypothetical protein
MLFIMRTKNARNFNSKAPYSHVYGLVWMLVLFLIISVIWGVSAQKTANTLKQELLGEYSLGYMHGVRLRCMKGDC